MRIGSPTGFSPVTDGEYSDLLAVEVVTRDIRSVSEGDDPLAKLGQHTFDEAADPGITAEFLHSASDRLHRFLGCFRTFMEEEGVKTSDVGQRGW